MLPAKERGDTGPLLVMLHWLGGSSRTWDEVGDLLAPQGVRCAAIDLPGFGDAADAQAFSIDAMVRHLIDTIQDLRKGTTDSPWLLAGHSMGGKLAAILARHAEDGTPGLENLCGLVLLSPSPTGPEPMDESKHEQASQSLGQRTLDRAAYRKSAEKFVDDNIGNLPLLDAVKQRTVDDQLRMNPDALLAWMTTGSKEDWSQKVGVLTTPALIMAGTEEKALNPGAQKIHSLPHFAKATLVPLEGGGHLSPLERPREVADRMTGFFREQGLIGQPAPALSPEFSALISSNRISPPTREVLLKRLQDQPVVPVIFNPEERRTLRSLAARIVPGARFDLASRFEATLTQPRHDGWRFNALPEDIAAWKQGLLSLNASAQRGFGVPFIALDDDRQDTMLRQAQAGDLGKGLLGALHLGDSKEAYSPTQMRDWFEDVRGEFAKLYTADPRTMERIGFTGFADEEGFTHITLPQPREVHI